MSVVFGNWGSSVKRRKIASNVKMYADATNTMYAAAEVEQPMMVPTPVEAESMLVEAMKRVVRALEPYQSGPDVLTGDIFSTSTSVMQKRLQMHDVLLTGLAGAAAQAKPAKKKRLLTELEQAKRMGVAYVTFSKMSQLATAIEAPVPVTTAPLAVVTPPDAPAPEASEDSGPAPSPPTPTDDTTPEELTSVIHDLVQQIERLVGSKEIYLSKRTGTKKRDDAPIMNELDELVPYVKGKEDRDLVDPNSPESLINFENDWDIIEKGEGSYNPVSADFATRLVVLLRQLVPYYDSVGDTEFTRLVKDEPDAVKDEASDTPTATAEVPATGAPASAEVPATRPATPPPPPAEVPATRPATPPPPPAKVPATGAPASADEASTSATSTSKTPVPAASTSDDTDSEDESIIKVKVKGIGALVSLSQLPSPLKQSKYKKTNFTIQGTDGDYYKLSNKIPRSLFTEPDDMLQNKKVFVYDSEKVLHPATSPEEKAAFTKLFNDKQKWL